DLTPEQADLAGPGDDAGGAGSTIAADSCAERGCGALELAEPFVSDSLAGADDHVGLVERVRGWLCRPRIEHGNRYLGMTGKLEAPELALASVRLQRLEHARADGRELGRRRAHDHRDDVAAVGGLVLDQASTAVDPEVDAVAGHAKLELAGNAWA